MIVVDPIVHAHVHWQDDPNCYLTLFKKAIIEIEPNKFSDI